MRGSKFFRTATLALCLGTALPAAAVEPGELLADPALEARARKISAELRCLVCQNQSIDDSNAPLARDLRLIVREELSKGATDAAIMDYVVARYGEFVLLRPRFGAHTLALWATPFLLLAAAAFALRRLSSANPAHNNDLPLTAEEQASLDALLAAANQTPSKVPAAHTPQA